MAESKMMWGSMHTKSKGPSIGTTFDGTRTAGQQCSTALQDSNVSMWQMRLLWAAADGQLKAEQVADGDTLARGAAEQACGEAHRVVRHNPI